MAHPLTFSHLVSIPFLFCFSCTSSAYSDQLSSSFASTQNKFWSENVNNRMPAAISTKLSPLTKQDSDYYAKAISQNNFKADTKFCAIAKLACSTAIDEIKGLQGRVGPVAYRAEIPLEKVDPFFFFRLSILKEAYTIHLSDLKGSLPFRTFLPLQIASRIYLSLKGITKIFPESNTEAIDTTLSYCDAAAIKGEFKSCPNSLEEMISFSKTTLGTTKLLALTSKSTTGSGKELTIEKIKQFNVKKIVVCHEILLPFATYFCHSLASSRIYSVDLVEPKTGAPVNTPLAICHMDTSLWPKNHVAFKILKFAPGQGEACHWMSEIDLIWIADEKNI